MLTLFARCPFDDTSQLNSFAHRPFLCSLFLSRFSSFLFSSVLFSALLLAFSFFFSFTFSFNRRNSQYLTILQSTGHSASGITCSPLKSPIIRNTYQTISLRPDGSPLLSDYITDGSESPTSAASSIQQHFYERPSNATATVASMSSNSTTGVVDSLAGQPLHSMNIPLSGYGTGGGGGPSNLPLQTPPPPLPPMLPERGYLRLPQTLHHSIRPHPSSTRTLLPHHQLLTHAMMNQHSYRSLSRQRTRSGLEYSDFRA